MDEIEFNNYQEETAKILLDINAIKLSPNKPFIWASGWKSPIYCDNRITLSYPQIRNYLRENIANQIEQLYGKPDVIAGVATGAIGIGMLVADFLNLPFIYIRPEAKKHGRQNQIEGKLEPGQSVVVVEDLISTGKSSLMAVDALKAAEANVKGMLAIFTYGFDISKNNFEEYGIDLYTLSDYDHLLEQASDTQYISEKEHLTLQTWRLSPDTWQAAPSE